MDPLEGTTLDLIYRRRVTTFYPGYTIILIVVGIIVALPLVKVDVVSTSAGMIRTFQEPTELFTSITGIVDSSLLKDHREVQTGDPLLWLQKKLCDTRMLELDWQIERNKNNIKDIKSILQGKDPMETSRYRQSFRNYTTSCRQLLLQKDFLHDEFKAAEILRDQQVIPEREYEQSRSKYLVCCAQLDDRRPRSDRCRCRRSSRPDEPHR